MYGAKIKELRKERGLTQAELAEIIGTKQSAIARVEKEEGSSTIATLEKIADALGVTVVELLGG